MLSRLGAHFRHNVVAYLALFIALGGTGAYAANTISSEDIVDGQVKTPDLADRNVTNRKLAVGSVGTGIVLDNSLQGRDIKDDSLTGADIDESSLKLPVKLSHAF